MREDLMRYLDNLEKQEISLLRKAMTYNLQTNHTKEGKMAEKGQANEILIKDIISLFDNVEVELAKPSSAADEILKVDLIITIKEEAYTDVYAIQIKSSQTGCDAHYENNGDTIMWEGVEFRTPYCIYVGSKTNNELFEEVAELLCVSHSLDLDKLEVIATMVSKANGKRLPINRFDKLSRKEIKALRLLFDVSYNGKTYFIK